MHSFLVLVCIALVLSVTLPPATRTCINNFTLSSSELIAFLYLSPRKISADKNLEESKRDGLPGGGVNFPLGVVPCLLLKMGAKARTTKKYGK